MIFSKLEFLQLHPQQEEGLGAFGTPGKGAPPEGPTFLPQRQASCLSHWEVSGEGVLHVPDPCARGLTPEGPRLCKATRLSATFLQPCCSWSRPGLPPTDRLEAKACEHALPPTPAARLGQSLQVSAADPKRPQP